MAIEAKSMRFSCAMKMLAFAPGAYNLAETTRMLEIAKACRHDFDIVFMSYGGRFEKLIREEGFSLRALSPQLTPEKIEHLYAVDRGEKLGDFFMLDEIREQVRSELALFRELKPVAVVTGFDFSLDVSARAARIPLVWVIQSTWTEAYQREFGKWPDLAWVPPLSWLPEKLLDKAAWPVARLFVSTLSRSYNRVAREHDVPEIAGLQIWEGDYTLLAEPPEFSGLASIPDRYRCIGPLIARLPGDVPEEIKELPRDLPLLWFAMGSSGMPKVVAELIQAFDGKPYRVIAPVKDLIERLRIKVPENVAVTGYLPAHLANPMADLSVIHGGIGTVMTAALAGKPIVGVGMQPEQEANLDCLVRKGCAIRIRRHEASPAALLAAVDRMLADEEAKRNAVAFKSIVEKWDGPSNAAGFFREMFGSNRAILK
jgi:UDP:flavonoid glycosyltransferase YjiC (YdhE family)